MKLYKYIRRTRDKPSASAAPAGNRLGGQTSPYLLQHAHQPVHWNPWDGEALARARNEDRPILMSIGYSSCHWCHVMAHEAFEDEETAAIMNEYYVSIKVDREERPDLDFTYQMAYMLMMGNTGGWPLNMFLTPRDLLPFFGGTYFPLEDRGGQPSFKKLLRYVVNLYRNRPETVLRHTGVMHAALRNIFRSDHVASEASLDCGPVRKAFALMQKSFDSTHGGFGGAPKFPTPGRIELLLHDLRRERDDELRAQRRKMALHTLRRMAAGGIYDHLGGGFFRYSVDEAWQIPHFEKMLYDNAQLLELYSMAWREEQDAVFAEIVNATAEWIVREMQSPEGGYYSAVDADDGNGREGGFYLWRPDQIREHVTPGERDVVYMYFGLDQASNFEGSWHLCERCGIERISALKAIPVERVRELLESGRGKLYKQRKRRPRHFLDDKVLACWNGLMIKGMAVAARVFGNRRWLQSAESALDFARARLWQGGGTLHRMYRDGRTKQAGYLEDYAALLAAALALLESRWRTEDLEFSVALADALLERFEDTEYGGFFFTPHEHEHVLQRQKMPSDGSTPSANGMAICALNRLGTLLGEPRYLQAAERALRCFWQRLDENPEGRDTLLLGLKEFCEPPVQIVLRGDADEMEAWRETCATCRVYAMPRNAGPLPGALGTQSPAADTAAAYICTGDRCLPPVYDLARLTDTLGELER